MGVNTNRDAIIASVEKFIDEGKIFGFKGKESEVLTLFRMLVKYEDMCTQQYEAGQTTYLEPLRQLKALIFNLRRACPKICNYKKRFVLENNKETNIAPIVDAGDDEERTIVDITNPYGSATNYPNMTISTAIASDSDGYIKTYQWTYVSGPGYVAFWDTDTATPSLRNANIGAHVLQLTVVDNEGASASDTMTYTVVEGVPPMYVDEGGCGTPNTAWVPVYPSTSTLIVGTTILYTDVERTIPYVGAAIPPTLDVTYAIATNDGGSPLPDLSNSYFVSDIGLVWDSEPCGV